MQCGYEVNPDTWEIVDKTWKSHQFSDGGWNYDGDGKERAAAASPPPR